MSSPSRCLEEDKGVLKSGVVTAAFAPVKSKKNFYAVLSERALELHENEKMYRKKKPAKHLVDLSVAFNVHNDHLDPKLKRCVCLMGPDDTLCIRAESEQANADWYEAILRAIIPSRAYKLCRPVRVEEFFEYCWDVDIVLTPKLKKPVNTEDTLPSMCEKQQGLEPGRRRLCFYPHTIILCKRKIEPAAENLSPSAIPPFSPDQFIELPRMFIAFFGSQERYFLIRMGRGSPTGACELWVQCESEEIANEVHVKLNYIIEREGEKKKKIQGGEVNVLPVLRTHHRERSHTQPLHMRNNSNALRKCSPVESTSTIGRKISNPGSASGSLSARSVSMSTGSGTLDPRTSHHSSSHPAWNIFPPPARRLSNTSSIKEEPATTYQVMGPSPSSVVSPPSNNASTEETEDSGGTLRLDNTSLRDEHGSTRSSQHSLIVAEAVIEHRSKDVSSSDNDERSSVGGVSRISTGTQDDSYTHMESADWNFGSNSHLIVPTQYDHYNLEEVRSFISDSTDSCYSSLAANSSTNGPSVQANTPRAYSFGGKTNMKPGSVNVAATLPEASIPDSVEVAANLVLPADDPRKRAFSLGSKSFFQYYNSYSSLLSPLFRRPFIRKTSHNRQQRLSQTSNSGASLSSSAASSFGPFSSSTNHLSTAADKDDYPRDRSGSFGSGRSTPYTKRGAASTAVISHNNDHHVEMDFSGLGRSGSGSVASVESPSRSRTSSFGNTRKDDFLSSYPMDLHDIELTPSQKVLQQLPMNDENGDYVLTEAPEPHVQQLLEQQNGYLSPSEPFKPMDLRNSQVIETIEENNSERSSLSSSRASVVEPDDDEYTMMECPPTTSDDKPSTSSEEPSEDSPDQLESNSNAEGLELPSGLPKRSSVPSMKSNDTDETSLNYACLQIQDDLHKPNSLPKESLLTTSNPSTRTRSKSGVVFSQEGALSLDYATVKPL